MVRIWQPDRMGALPYALRGGVVMLGNFDGFHLGHRALATLASVICPPGKPVIMMRCDPHPHVFFRLEKAGHLLSPQGAGARQLGAAGIDMVYAPRFNAEFAAQSPAEFSRTSLVETLGVRAVVCGADYCFGARRSGNVDILQELGLQQGFAVHVAPQVIDPSGEPVSSSAIRGRIAAGDLVGAALLLGHDWTVPIRADATGWSFQPGMIMPPDGAYFVLALAADEKPLGRGAIVIRNRKLAEVTLPPDAEWLRWTDLHQEEEKCPRH